MDCAILKEEIAKIWNSQITDIQENIGGEFCLYYFNSDAENVSDDYTNLQVGIYYHTLSFSETRKDIEKECSSINRLPKPAYCSIREISNLPSESKINEAILIEEYSTHPSNYKLDPAGKFFDLNYSLSLLVDKDGTVIKITTSLGKNYDLTKNYTDKLIQTASLDLTKQIVKQ